MQTCSSTNLPAPPTPCDGWAIRSGGPTGCHILVSLHTPSIVFFLPSLAGDHQTHLTDKLPNYTESPKMNPVAHVSLELGRTPPKLTLFHPCRLSSEAPSQGTGPLPAHVSTPQAVPVGSGLPQEPVRLWLWHCRLDAPQREGTAAVTPRVLRPVPRPPCPQPGPLATPPQPHFPGLCRPGPACAKDDIAPKHLATRHPTALSTLPSTGSANHLIKM